MINKLLKDYKDLTLKLIDEVSNIDDIEKLITEREKVIDSIRKVECDKETLVVLFNELDIVKNDEELITKLKSERVKTKKALDNVQKLKRARDIYDREEGIPLFFNMVSY